MNSFKKIVCFLIFILLLSIYTIIKSVGFDKEKVIETFGQGIDFYKEDVNNNINENIVSKGDENKEDKSKEKVQTDIEKNTNDTESKIVMNNVKIESQLPELRNGCEVVSLTMMMNFAGNSLTKFDFARIIEKDYTAREVKSDGTVYWGNPQIGFVGDIFGKNAGYGVYDIPIENLINKIEGFKAINLSKMETKDIFNIIREGKPVMVWITADYAEPRFNKKWLANGVEIIATYQEHCVLMTGFDEENIFFNDPLSGVKDVKMTKETFENIWTKMGSMAVSYEIK